MLTRPRPASERLGEIHDHGVALARAVKAATEDFVEGFSMEAPDVVEDGWQHMRTAESHLEKALDLIDGVCL